MKPGDWVMVEGYDELEVDLALVIATSSHVRRLTDDEIGFGATPTAAERLDGPKMNARHEGLCGDPGCINLIAPGCTIHLTTLGRWVCSDCADQLEEKL